MSRQYCPALKELVHTDMCDACKHDYGVGTYTCGYSEPEVAEDYRKDAQVKIVFADQNGQIAVKMTIKVLKPFPESALYFPYHDILAAKNVRLDGKTNTACRYFDTEQEGREWAHRILNAVVKVGNEERKKALAVTKQTIDIEFRYHPVGYQPSLLP